MNREVPIPHVPHLECHFMPSVAKNANENPYRISAFWVGSPPQEADPPHGFLEPSNLLTTTQSADPCPLGMSAHLETIMVPSKVPNTLPACFLMVSHGMN